MPGTHKPKTLTCGECRRDYVVIHPKPTRRYCSYACAAVARARSHRIDKTCPACGKAFTSRASVGTRYCSWKCMGVGKRKWPVMIVCAHCGKEAPRGPRKYAKLFCSRRCRGLHDRKAVGYITHQGYRVVYVDAKPVLEHRKVMEEMLGRPLLTAESVHHKNGDRAHNDPSNLELWDRSQPAGQRVADKIEWCRHFLGRHGLVVIPA